MCQNSLTGHFVFVKTALPPGGTVDRSFSSPIIFTDTNSQWYHLFDNTSTMLGTTKVTRVFPKVDHSAIQTFLPKTGVLDNYINTKSLPKLCQNFNKNLIETPVLGRNSEAKIS